MPSPAPERRRAPRAKATFSIHLGPPEQARPARLRDLSEIGLACIAGEAIPEMTQVALTMSLPGSTEQHQVTGAVVRCARLRNSAPAEYDLAVYFTEISPVCKAAIRGYVARGVKV